MKQLYLSSILLWSCFTLTISKDQVPSTSAVLSLPEPEKFALVYNEYEFEDHLEPYLQNEYLKKRPRDYTAEDEKIKIRVVFGGSKPLGIQVLPGSVGVTENTADSMCVISIRTGLSEPQPVYINTTSNDLIKPSGTSGTFQFKASESLNLNCGDGFLSHPSIVDKTLRETTLFCKDGTLFEGRQAGFNGIVIFKDVVCTKHVNAVEQGSLPCGATGTYIDIKFPTHTSNSAYITSCFNKANAETLFVNYSLSLENAVHQNVSRPDFKDNYRWFPGLNVDNLYSRESEINALDSILGSGMGSRYIRGNFYFARGHLAAKADFVLSTTQRNTFTFINVAPQWQPFNGGNWSKMERRLRERLAFAGIYATIYAGTWGRLTLKDNQNIAREIYLSPSDKKIPVPLWFYKVVYEPSTQRGIVFLGLNNPYVDLETAKNLAFCSDVCSNNSNFDWIGWSKDNVTVGYSLCCDVNDFRETVTILPSFNVSGLLML